MLLLDFTSLLLYGNDKKNKKNDHKNNLRR